jgi:putative membrane-bound dehydrogenase-like protein
MQVKLRRVHRFTECVSNFESTIQGLGGPAVPSGRPGRVSDEKPRHAGANRHSKAQRTTRPASGFFSPSERGWRGFLSLRDPAGAADQRSSRRCPAGPPDQFPSCPKNERIPRRLLFCVAVAVTFAICRPGRATEPGSAATPAKSHNGNRLTYLDENNPWYPHRNFPKLITPQWVGEEGVECVVILAIDDMREPAKYEAFLRPILDRLKKIDGRAPVSIMTCNVKPDDPQLASWLSEGLSFEVHTIDHPCPLLQGGDIAKAKSTYDRCVDLLNEIPGNRPTAFRMPCCDSLNTVSPRFYSEIFNKTTEKGNYLAISSSVFNLFTSNDPDIPRELVIDADGRDKFRKYIPKGLVREGATFNTFVNYIEDYPYPYVINRLCWEFPCVTPSDWSAQHLQKPNNPDTVRDLKAALDITVLKQGVYNLVFHPHNWIKPEQIVELIDHAVAKHGKKVKFLTFREAYERLNKNVTEGIPLRNRSGANATVGRDRSESLQFELPPNTVFNTKAGRDAGLRFVDIDEDGHDDIVFSNDERFGVYLFNDMQTGWSRVVLEGTRSAPEASGRREPAGSFSAFTLPPIVRADGTDNGFFVHSRHLFWQNEDTAKLPDLVDRRSFNEILAQAPDLQPRAKLPEAALKSMHLRPGFKIELMAAEPLVLDPISFAFGADGKLWVVEMGDYPLGPSGGQIRCLEDTDGDGRFDKTTIFLEVPYPTGVLPWRKGVLVIAAPNVFYAEDTDGDGKADKREILYTGFVEGNQQHRANGLVLGLDNWIYVANGDSGGVIESKKTGKKVNINGRDLRIRPDTGDLDAVTGQTQFGRSRDDWGNWFGCNNANPMYQFVLDDAYQRRNPHYSGASPRIDVPEEAGQAPVFPESQLLERFNDLHTANRFTSVCSAMIYRDDLFGPHFAGNAFICEPVHNLVHREVVSPKGVTFSSKRAADEQESEFLASTDNWFRPTTVKTGPDGALWIADMYRHVIEHPQWIPDVWQKKLDLRAGHDQGRIYRVYPVDKKPRPIPRLDKLDSAGLVAALDSPSGWQRDMAQQLLLERKDERAIPMLEKQLTRSANALCRLHALAAIAGFGPVREAILLGALEDRHPGVRRHAVRLCGETSQDRTKELIVVLVRHATDNDPQVRLQLAYTLGECNDPAAARALGQMLVADGSDRFLFSALMSSVNKANVGDVLSSVLAASGTSAPNQDLIGSLLDLSAAYGDDQALVKLMKYVTQEKDGRFADWQFTVFARLLDSLARRNESLANKVKASKVSDADQLLAGVDRLFDSARNLVADAEGSLNTRVAAVRLLGRGRDQGQADLELLGSLLSPQNSAELQEAAVLALGRLRHDRIPKLLLESWKGFGPARRSQVLDLLVSRDPWAAELMAAVADGSVAGTEFDAARRQRLLEHRSAEIRQKAAAAFATIVNVDRQRVIDEYQPALDMPGNRARGAQLFTKTCAQCHKLAGLGHDVGPDLRSVSDKSPEAILVAVLDPNRAVESRYLTYVAATNAGMTYSGLLASETGNSITLRGPEGKEQVILRADLDELVSTSKSTMPEGLEKDLSPQDLADIIAHVRSNIPLAIRKEFAGNEPVTISPAPDGSLLLAASACEVYGSTLLYELQYENLGYWASLDDHAVWTVDGAKPGKYGVEFEWACDASVAGNPWQIDTAGGTITGKVASTGNWDTYRHARVGEITLAAGKQRLVMRPTRKPQGAMIDLKAIRLVPVK